MKCEWEKEMIEEPQSKTLKKRKLPVARSKEIVIQETGQELLIYDLKTNEAHSLNETASLVWKQCDGTKSASEISNKLSLETKDQYTEELVWLTLDQLNENNLLVGDLMLDEYRGKVSRRDLIRKVGIGSMIALPLISMITAPKAVRAQSNCQPLLVCLPPGTNICPPSCNGRTLQLIGHSTTNGSCGGSSFFGNRVCGAAPMTLAFDVRVNGII